MHKCSVYKRDGLTLWEILNSNFCLWFLSSVVIASSVHIITERENSRKEREAYELQNKINEQKNKEAAEKAAIEISYRFSSILTKLNAIAANRKAYTEQEMQSNILNAIMSMRKHDNDDYPSLYIEYKPYSTLALLAELRRLTAGDADQTTVTNILTSTSMFVEEVAQNKNRISYTPEYISKEFVRRVYSKRWDVGFPYMNCTYKDPFC